MGPMTRGLSFANYDGSSLPREPMGARIGLGIGPIWGMPVNGVLHCFGFMFGWVDIPQTAREDRDRPGAVND